MNKDQYIYHYRAKIRLYFEASTDENKIQINGTLHECEFVLENVFEMTHQDVMNIYNEEYRRTFAHTV